MAFDENSNLVSYDDGYDYQQNLSRSSVRTMYTDHDDDKNCDVMNMYMSRLSIENFDADEELSDDEKQGKLDHSSSYSDKEHRFYSLPATPPRRRNRGNASECAGENEAQKGTKITKNSRRKKRVNTEKWFDSNNTKSFAKKEDDGAGVGGFSGDSEGGLVVITRPKGGRRTLCMGLDEVKACRDLGFELEPQCMFEMPSRVSVSGSNIDSSSGGNSPIANWRISGPGDNPKDVKARLKVWAHVVALASASRHGCLI